MATIAEMERKAKDAQARKVKAIRDAKKKAIADLGQALFDAVAIDGQPLPFDDQVARARALLDHHAQGEDHLGR